MNDLGLAANADDDVVTAALAALKRNYQVPSESVSLRFANGLLTMGGTVDSEDQKTSAEQCVSCLSGVVRLLNTIVVKPEEAWLDVEGQIEQAFRRHMDFDARRICVAIECGIVTLTGRAKSWAERDHAAWAAGSVPGVLVVRNNVTVCRAQ